MSLKALYLEFSNLSPLLFSPVTFLLLITIHAITWKRSSIAISRRDANKVSISSTTVTKVASWRRRHCSRLRSNGAVTKWIRDWPKWDNVSVGTRKADFRSLYTHSFVRRRDDVVHHLSGRSLVISVFLFFSSSFYATLPFLVCRVRLGLFPTRGIVYDDLWLRSTRTSQHHRYIHANSCPILEANQDFDALFLCPCLMNPHEY